MPKAIDFETKRFNYLMRILGPDKPCIATLKVINRLLAGKAILEFTDMAGTLGGPPRLCLFVVEGQRVPKAVNFGAWYREDVRADGTAVVRKDMLGARSGQTVPSRHSLEDFKRPCYDW
jgi:hypothetical protein